MASLQEIKGRIRSVNSTLKITSAMKMVASAKLRKAEAARGNLVPYESRLRRILTNLIDAASGDSVYTAEREMRNVALVLFASNSALCGAFNANAIRVAKQTISAYEASKVNVSVYAVGRKMAEAMKKSGHPAVADFTKMAAAPDYVRAAALGRELTEGFLSGRFDKVEFIYNHFASTASQPTRRETYLPLPVASMPEEEESADRYNADYILEPDRQRLLEELLPKSLMLKVYTVLLDSATAEHAARTVAMQTATDNGNDLLRELTLEYNKGRQQHITNELLDIAGGSLQ